MQFLSDEWIQRYGEIWNGNDALTGSLSNFNNRLQYRYSDKDLPPVQLLIQNGKCTYAGPMQENEKIDFDMFATAENWEKICKGDIGPRSALLTKKLGFNGSMITAMKHMSSFEDAIRLMGTIESRY